MLTCIKATIAKGCINLMYLDYIYNTNPEKNVDVLKHKINEIMDTHTKNTFDTNVFKFRLKRSTNRFKYMYPTSYPIFDEVIEILNKDTFTQEFKTAIAQCNDLYVLYLYFVGIIGSNNTQNV